MVFLIDPGDIIEGGGGCRDKGCGVACKNLCSTLCGPHIIPMYGIPLED